MKNRKIQMNEAGLGPESAIVIGQILASKVPIEVEDPYDGERSIEVHTFAHLDLGKNNLGNIGMMNLLKSVMRCDTLVSLDLGSNDIMLDGASHLFRTLKRHASLSVLTIANHDRLHRNRIGINACADLRDYLADNKVISSLNIADNRIGNEGLAVIAPALNKDCVLCIFNLSNNDLDGVPAVEHLAPYLNSNRNLLELNLSNNKLGDTGLGRISEIFHDNKCHLQRLYLQNCEFTALGASQLFESIRLNSYLRNLNLSHNDLSGSQFHGIYHLLWTTKQLFSLSLASCRLGKPAAEAIGTGLSKNTTL